MKRSIWLMLLTAVLAGSGCLYNSDKAPWAHTTGEAKPQAKQPEAARPVVPAVAAAPTPVAAEDVNEQNAALMLRKLTMELDRAELESVR